MPRIHMGHCVNWQGATECLALARVSSLTLSVRRDELEVDTGLDPGLERPSEV